jgi:hypothetical protein
MPGPSPNFLITPKTKNSKNKTKNSKINQKSKNWRKKGR